MGIKFNEEQNLRAYLVEDKKGKKEFRNKQSLKIQLFPYDTSMGPSLAAALDADLKSFDAYIGQCCRLIAGKDFPKEFKESKNYKQSLKQAVLKAVVDQTECESEHAEKLTSIISSLFFNEDTLIKYSYKALWYTHWNKYDSTLPKKAQFIRSVFFDRDFEKELLIEDGNQEHILYKLIDNALPSLEQKNGSATPYHIISKEVAESFKKDFMSLKEDKKAYLSDIEKLFRFYYFIYIAHSVYILNNFFFKGNLKDYKLYFTLEEETVSESRRTYKEGWNQLEPKVETIFSHAICLDLINQISLDNCSTPLDYVELAEYYKASDCSTQEQIIEAVKSINSTYRQYIPPPNDAWQGLDTYIKGKLSKTRIENDFEKVIVELWCSIEYQFLHSKRLKPRKGFANWFIFFCKRNFLKSRGRNGYSLNLNHEMLLFLTKLCIGSKSKIRLKDLWTEFAQRGMHFDDASQQAIIKVYEKINLIEKKSDSGDAQYVRSIL